MTHKADITDVQVFHGITLHVTCYKFPSLQFVFSDFCFHNFNFCLQGSRLSILFKFPSTVSKQESSWYLQWRFSVARVYLSSYSYNYVMTSQGFCIYFWLITDGAARPCLFPIHPVRKKPSYSVPLPNVLTDYP